MDEPTPDMADEAPDKGTSKAAAAGDGDLNGPAAEAASSVAVPSEAPAAAPAKKSRSPRKTADGSTRKTADRSPRKKADSSTPKTADETVSEKPKAPKKAGPKGKTATKDAGAKPTKPVKKGAAKKSSARAPVEEPEPTVPAPPPIVVPDDAKWYVVHTYSGYENKVKRNLEHRIESMGMLDRIFQVVVPVEEEVDIKDGQRRLVERKIFPGYVLVRLVLDDESWSVVRNTPGVTGFVGSSSGAERLKPTALRPEEVDGILKRMDAEEPTIRVTFRQGQNVRIVDGPFTDFHGVVDAIDMARGKVRLMVNFFGRETLVELDFLQVEKV